MFVHRALLIFTRCMNRHIHQQRFCDRVPLLLLAYPYPLRDPASEKSQALASKGAELVKLDDDKTLDAAFAGTDVIVNALPGSASEATQLSILQAAARSSAKVYFLDEFGS